MGLVKSCIVGPHLNTIYIDSKNIHDETIYNPNSLEKMGTTVITGLYTLGHVGLYTTPIWVPVFSKCCGFYTALKGGVGLGVLLGLGVLVRGLGRRSNKSYIQFLEVLSSLDLDEKPSEEAMRALRRYDFDYSAWPINFKWSDVPEKDR
ncbi:hypothetical protein Pcinc_039185 [Petrolisthes cinctipes]|uniref:Phosphatidylserine Lipase ABHD16 N-terminal domain-containing protein n=1 Tax=Petrolisthes cinctipes TaxID=88211 RepID=A0AAE1BHP5_PETCI|nr:hypothetical protein Pcinc_042818 [Petrolisthes cinctipes]KAK3854326.1 hypothetical protein Pcinc_039185 [Petrolisthes cinctipes]